MKPEHLTPSQISAVAPNTETAKSVCRSYQERIAELVGPKYDPRHIEAYIRLEHSTLDGLSLRQFGQECGIARQCVDADGAQNAESLARSFGL